jgi:hypothetical protein
VAFHGRRLMRDILLPILVFAIALFIWLYVLPKLGLRT